MKRIPIHYLRAVVAIALLVFFVTLLLVLMPSQPIFGSRPLPTLSAQTRLFEMEDNLRRNRPLQALYQLEVVASQTGWTPELYRTAGDLWDQMGDRDRALAAWELASQSDSDPLLARKLAETYITRREWNSASEALRQVLIADPTNTWANYELGMILAPFDPVAAERHLQQAGLDRAYSDGARAVRVMLLENREAGALDDFTLPMLVGLTMVEYELWPYAELAFDHANTVSLATTGAPLPEALAYLSLTRDEQGSDGTSALLESIRLDPNNAQIRFLQALYFRRREDYTASLNAMIQAVSLAPESPALYAELGTAYRLVGDLEQSERWLQAAVAFSGNDPRFEQILETFYVDEAYNLGTDGLNALNDTLRNRPDDPDLLAGLGWSFYQLGDETMAQEYIDQALTVDAQNPRAQYYRALILLDSEDSASYEEAKTLLQTVAEVESPVQADAMRILRGLE